MTHHELESTSLLQALELLREGGFDGMAQALEILFNEAFRLEQADFLGAAPHERSPDRVGYRNGYKPKTVHTRAGPLELQIPQVRSRDGDQIEFYPQSLERGLRSERALKLAIAEMYINGVSTRRVTRVMQELCGLDVTSSQVSRATRELDAELESWRSRPLDEQAFPYVVLDARYEKIRHGGSVVSCGVLVACGVRADGKRTVLGVSVALSEAEVHWRSFLESLQGRGLHGVRLVVSDDHQGIKAALGARFPGVTWQRCQVHLQRNATAYVPRVEMRAGVAEDLRSIFRAADQVEATDRLRRVVDKYQASAPKLATWIEESVPEGLAVLDLPTHHRRRLGSTNMLERLNREIKRRTAVATLFPNEDSLLRLVTAIVVETAEEWETGRTYLSMNG